MNTITIQPDDKDQETVIRLFLDALHVTYKLNEEKSIDEAILPSPRMPQHINTMAEHGHHSDETKISFDDMFSDISL